MSNGNLSEYIDKNKEKIDKLFGFISMNRIFQGMKYIHSNSLIHRDLKPSNILVDHDCNVFISDFDLVREIDLNAEMTKDIGSLIYCSPEQYSGKKIDIATDIYSFGLLVYFIFEKKDLKSKNDYKSYFDEENPKNVTEMISSVPKQIKYIIQNCIKYYPKERLTNDDIFKIMYKQMNSFEFLDSVFLNENEQSHRIPTIIQHFYENISYLYQENNILKIKIHIYYIFLFLNVLVRDSNASSIIKLGKLYASGKSFEKDYEKAQKYFEYAIQNNNPFGLIEIGQLFANGRGGKKDYKKAFKYYELASKHDIWKGYYLMGECYFNGNGVTKNIEKGNEFFQLAIKNKNPKALLQVGTFYYYNNKNYDYSKAKYYIEQAANQKNSKAQYLLGIIYSEGKWAEADYQKAKYFYELSIKNNCLSAYINLSNLYYDGNGVSKDYSKSIYYLKEAAQKYNIDGLINISKDY